MSLRVGIFLCVLLAAAGAGDSGDELADTGSRDTCDYRGNVRCGDQCISMYDFCQCGNETIRPWVDDQHCCLSPGGSCTRDGSNAVCNEGRTLSMSSRCENTNRYLTCHNTYKDSKYIGPKSHFSCPHTCVPWDDMCRGLDWCPEELNKCGDPTLRCPGYDGFTKHNITTSAGSAHHYCLSTAHINNRQYDSIDRDDEKNVTTQGSALDIDITSFIRCNDSFNDPGVMCGPKPDDDCRWSGYWCNEAKGARQCDTGSELISTADSRLCSNPEVCIPLVHFGRRRAIS